MLHAETVCESTLDLLKDILQVPDLSSMRLVGGTALSLQLGHRTSVDLDFFGKFDPMKSFRKVLVDRGHVVEGAESGDVQSLVVDGVKVDLVNYPYGWLTDAICQDGMRLAGLDDIVAMKLSTAAYERGDSGFENARVEVWGRDFSSSKGRANELLGR